MKRKLLKIPISVKLIVIFVGFLSVATIIFAQQSSALFEKVLVQREEYSNMTEAGAKAIEVEQSVLSLLEKTQSLGNAYYVAIQENKNNTTDLVAGPPPSAPMPLQRRFQELFEKEKSLVNIEIWQQKDQQLTLLARRTRESFLNEQKMSPQAFNSFRSAQRFPLSSVLQKNFEIRNASRPGGPALGTLGLPLVRDAQDQVTHLVLADFSLAVLQKSFAHESERIQYLVDKNGFLLAHPDENKILSQADASTSPLVSKALADQQPRRQIQFTDSESNEQFIGAYVKLGSLGLTVLSQTSKSIILEPAHHVKRQAFYIAGVVISIAIVLIFLFSMTLTGPIEVLAALVRHVSKGNFDIKASDRIRSLIEDEVHELAHDFDHMTEGLKERDKVKSLFSKFHGSSVAEDLIKNDVGVGGQNKEVTVFFSDIRGFTAFSEHRSPEQVVEMLNSYFEVMVSIINRHGGVVDKFIGDAIMAVWGAPKTGEQDTFNAVKACLEMRKALVDLNAARAERNEEPIKIGMGLHTGRAISGTIGSLERMEYTVIGDTVNMTSRIEASTKSFGTDLLVSQAVVDKIGENYLIDLAGAAEVKGKTEPLKLYKVRGYKDLETGDWIEIETEFSSFAKEHDEKVKVAG